MSPENILHKIDLLEKKKQEKVNQHILPIELKIEELKNKLFQKAKKTMNYCDCFVTKILSEPYFQYEKWWLDVEYDSEGALGLSSLMRDDKDDFKNVGIGFKFMA